MSVINANSDKVQLLRYDELTKTELDLISKRDTTVYTVDFKKMDQLLTGKFEGADFGYVRISFDGKPDVLGQILVPVLVGGGPNVELWSILFCPPGKITATGESIHCKNDEELRISLHGS